MRAISRLLQVVWLMVNIGTTAAWPQTGQPEPSLWDHNGSVVYLIANGALREFYYKEPRPGMLEQGARPGSLLFRGQTANGQYFGTAYIFNRRCGQFSYETRGPILDNYERVVLTGQAPRVGPDCDVKGYITDTLEFTLLNTRPSTSISPTLTETVRLDDIVGKWSDSPDKNTCEIPVGSSPDPATLYQLSSQSLSYYELDCLIQDVFPQRDGVDLNLDCFKGGGSRWFEKLRIHKIDANRLSLAFEKSSQDKVTVYRCPYTKETEPSARPATITSQWIHNGSIMSLEENGVSVEIDYLDPKKEMMAVGVRVGTMLFLGTRDGEQIEGSAYIFHPKCGPIRYNVKGRFFNNQRVVLEGLSPRVGSNCEEIRSVPDVLIFERK